MEASRKLLILATGCALVASAARAEDNVQGVKWRAKTSIQSKALNMPERTAEVCLPATDADQAAIKQGEAQKNCKMTSVQRSGGKTVADMQCTGEHPSSTHIEVVKDGDTMHSTMTMKTASDTRTIKSDYTKLGGACEMPKNPAAAAAALSQGTLEERKKRLQEMMGGAGK
ncbi:MAG: DUF3617 family protein [Pseudomonadota bacterium]